MTLALSTSVTRPSYGREAFTLVEIALCMAVVSIAMVAIIGVLPAGLNVQRQNREEAVLNQDAEVLLNVVRAGQVGSQDLVNYVDRVTLVRTYADGSPALTNHFHGPLVAGTPASSQPFIDAFQLVGLISRPRYTMEASSKNPSGLIRATNSISLEMRSMSGSMANLPVIRSGNVRTSRLDPRIDFAFRYRVAVEIVTRPTILAPDDPFRAADSTANGVSEMRLTLEWPLIRNGVNPNQYRMGLNSREFRTDVVGIPAPLLGNVPQDSSYFGSVLFPFNPLSNKLSPSDILLYRLQPGAL